MNQGMELRSAYLCQELISVWPVTKTKIEQKPNYIKQIMICVQILLVEPKNMWKIRTKTVEAGEIPFNWSLVLTMIVTNMTMQ